MSNAPPKLDRAARRRAKKLRRKAERAAARAAAKAAATSPQEATPGDVTPEEAAPEEATPEEAIPEDPGFRVFDLIPELLKAVDQQKFVKPTPIQMAAIPPLLASKDVVGQAQTGTGKTAAFALPMLQRIDISRPVVQAIVLVPTRELANQVCAEITALARPLRVVSVLAIYGGQAIFGQLKRLRRGVHIVVGTPGRVMDHLRRESLSLADTTTVVLDEADEMLKMGFLEDVGWILEQAPGPEARQTALFSATLPAAVRRVAERHLTDPVSIAIEPGTPAIATIDQRFLWAAGNPKFDALCRLLEMEDGDSTLVFTRTRAKSADLAEALCAEGFAAEALHGELSQAQRESVLRKLRRGAVRVVVATDVAARGLDVDTITLVVNFDAPEDAETYVHRIGRTGRAGRAGVAVLFLHPRERRVLAGIQRFTKQTLTEIHPPTLRDVVDHRVGRFKAAVGRSIANTDLETYRRLVEDIAGEGTHDMATVAAAVAQLAAQGRPIFPTPDPGQKPHHPPRVQPPPAPAPPPGPSHQHGSHGPGKPIADMVPLVLSLGSDAGLTPSDVVGAIANEAGVPGRAIGAIDIGDRNTIVDVSVKYARRVLDLVKGAKIRGRRLHIRPARPGEATGRSASSKTSQRPNARAGWGSPRRGPR